MGSKDKGFAKKTFVRQMKKKKYADLDLPLVLCLIFCAKIESLELFRWRFEFNY